MIGRIYRIIHTESEICYIGSTFNELRHRWQNHKNDYQKWLKGKHSEVAIYPYFKEHGIDNFKIILIKEYEVFDRTHLEGYEQLWINKFKKTCVNKNNSFSINKLYRKLYQKQYREDNRESIVTKKKQYYLQNKEKKKQYYIENKDKWKQYREANKEAINEKKKQYREANRESIRAYQNQNQSCICGGKYTTNNKAVHLKTKKHQNWLKTLH